VASTENECDPGARPASRAGLEHGAAGRPSSEQANVAGSSASQATSTSDGLPSAGGTCVKLTSGLIVSTVQRRSVGGPGWPPLTTRTRNPCSPCASPVSVRGEVQAANAPPSSEHSKLDPGGAAGASHANVAASLATKPEGALVKLMPVASQSTSVSVGSARTCVSAPCPQSTVSASPLSAWMSSAPAPPE
jgi:hypothetical protein